MPPSSAAWCISFLGMQPTFTQVPPRPHRVPGEVGRAHRVQVSQASPAL